MRKILYLAEKEILLLKKSIGLITVILTVFLAAFMGILSVRLNFVNGFFDTLDETCNSFLVMATNISMSTAENYSGGGLVFGEKYGLTGGTTLYANGGKFCDTDYYGEEPRILGGVCVVLNGHSRDKFASASGALIKGKWIEGEGQICLEKFVAQQLEAGVGDTVEISGNFFTLTGIYDLAALKDDYLFNNCYYCLSGFDNYVMNTVSVILDDASSAYSLYKKLAGKGYNPIAKDEASNFFYTIPPVEWTLNAVMVVLLIVLVIIQYTLMTVFYRQRKKFICQLKLLGADNLTVTAVYLLVSVCILLIANALAAAMGIAFNIYFMNLCESIFRLPFKAAFDVWIPFAAFAVSCAMAAILYAVAGRKTKSEIIAEEIRCE